MGFGSTARDSTRVSRSLSLRLLPRGLASPRTVTRGLIMQKASGHPSRGSHSFVGARFQVCFTPLAGVLFTFPSRYWFAIGHQLVFSLGGWAPRIRTGFHVSRPTWDAGRPARDFAYGAFTRCGRTFQTVPLSLAVPCPGPATPGGKPPGLGSSAFARHYSRNLVDFFSCGY